MISKARPPRGTREPLMTEVRGGQGRSRIRPMRKSVECPSGACLRVARDMTSGHPLLRCANRRPARVLRAGVTHRDYLTRRWRRLNESTFRTFQIIPQDLLGFLAGTVAAVETGRAWVIIVPKHDRKSM